MSSDKKIEMIPVFDEADLPLDVVEELENAEYYFHSSGGHIVSVWKDGSLPLFYAYLKSLGLESSKFGRITVALHES